MRFVPGSYIYTSDIVLIAGIGPVSDSYIYVLDMDPIFNLCNANML